MAADLPAGAPAVPEADAVDLNEAVLRYNQAYGEVGELAEGTRKWTMHIPAEPERDSDLVISTALDRIPSLVAEVLRLRDDLAEMYSSAGADYDVRQEYFAEKKRAETERDAALAEVERLGVEVEKSNRTRTMLSQTIAACPEGHHDANLAHARTERDHLRAEVARLTAELADAGGYEEFTIDGPEETFLRPRGGWEEVPDAPR